MLIVTLDRNYWKQSVQIPTDHDITLENQAYDQVSTFQQPNREYQEDYIFGSCPAYDTVSAQSQL